PAPPQVVPPGRGAGPERRLPQPPLAEDVTEETPVVGAGRYRHAVVRRFAEVQRDRGGLGGGGIRRRDIAVREHPVDDVVAPAQRGGPVRAGRVVVGRGLYQSGDRRRLVQRQLVGRGGEVHVRGGEDAVRPVSEVRDVEVPLEDRGFAHPLLQRDGQPHLA